MSLDELVQKHNVVGERVKAAKAVNKDSEETKTALAELLDLKKQITAIDPNHALAIKSKEKKKKEKKVEKEGPSKKELRKAEREAKAAKMAEEKAEKEASATNYGDLPLIQSQGVSKRKWHKVEELNEKTAGQNVLVRARIHTSREQSKMVFLLLRQGCNTVQAVLTQGGAITKEMNKYVAGIPRESVVDVEGKVVKVDQAISAATQSNVEIQVTSVFAVSKAAPELPFQVADASKRGSIDFAGEGGMAAAEGTGTEVAAAAAQAQQSVVDALHFSSEAGKREEAAARAILAALGGAAGDSETVDDVIKVGLDTRLNYRWIDLRTPANQSIMRIKSAVSMAFRNFLHQRGFVEIQSPKINFGASEGGANCFTLKYMEGTQYEKPACLAQSPQLYKQMTAASGGFERVFEVGPVFRAENSHTHRHLCEFTGLDMEMAINEHYYEALDMFSDLFIHIFSELKSKYAHEINVIAQMYPVAPFEFHEPKALRITFAEGVKLLQEHGLTEEEKKMGCTPQGPMDDLSTPNEKLLGRIVKEKYGTDFFMMDEYPMQIRPFYTMPSATNPAISNSYDFFMRGEEILSGAQRIHDVEKLLWALRNNGPIETRAHGMPMPEDAISAIMGYVDSFRHGALPHAGGGVGLERVVMLFLGLKNIRLASFFPRDPKRLSP